jgi:hypothetical protein
MIGLRSEKDIRLRIDLLEGQSSSIAQMLVKAIRHHDKAAFSEYAQRLEANRSRVEELLWVLGEKAGQSVLDLPVVSKDNNKSNNNTILPVRDMLEKLRAGELRMDDLTADAQKMVRKGALEMKNAKNG